MLMLDEFVLHLLFQISLNIHLRHRISHILHRMKSVQIVLCSHVKRGCEGALLYISSDMQILIGPTIRQAVYQARVAGEGKDDVLVLGEKSVSARAALRRGFFSNAILAACCSVRGEGSTVC